MAETQLALRGVQPRNIDELMKIAEMAFKGGVCPRGVGRPETAAAIIAMGAEVGLTPMQSLQNIMHAKSKDGGGKLSIWGDAMLALVRGSGKLKLIRESIAGDGDDRTATCIVHRVGDEEPRTFTFSMADARKANLLTKAGPWQEYPDRQLTMRARSWALRDTFTDVLCGLIAAEEASDYADVQIATVEPVKTAAASSSPSLSVPAPAVDVMVSDEQLQQIATLRESFIYQQTAKTPKEKDDFAAAWKSLLKKHVGPAIESAKQLTAEQADALLKVMTGEPGAAFL